MFENLLGGKKEEATTNKPAITIAPAPQAPVAQVPAQTGTGKDVTAEVEDVKKDVEKVKDSLNALRGSLKSITEKLEEMEKNMGQLASIYEVISNQMNPFLDEEEKMTKAPQPAPIVEEFKEAAPKVEAGVVLDHVDLTNPRVIQIILDWTQFLVEKVGHEGVGDLLQYYVDIKWISEEVAEILRRYAEGINVETEPAVAPPVKLDPEDHMKCLDYIMQIKEVQG